MAYTAHPETTRRITDTSRHVITTIVAAIGVVAAGVGAFIAFGTVDGTVTLFDWTWNTADLSDLWAPFLMIGGGLLAAAPMAFDTFRDMEGDTNRWIVGVETLVALAGIAALVVGVVLLF